MGSLPPPEDDEMDAAAEDEEAFDDDLEADGALADLFGSLNSGADSGSIEASGMSPGDAG